MIDFLPPEKIDHLIKEVKNPLHKTAMAFISYAGLRVEELFSLTSNLFNDDLKYFRVVFSKKERPVPIHPKLKPILREFLKNPCDSLFNFSYQNLLNIVRKNAKRVFGIDINPTILRNSFIHLCWQEKKNQYEIADILGETSMKRIYRYQVLMEDKENKETEKKGLLKKLFNFKNKLPALLPITFRDKKIFRGREMELEKIKRYIKDGKSVVIHGEQGCGKSFLISQLGGILIEEFERIKSLKDILISENIATFDKVKKMEEDEIIEQLKNVKKVILFDDITEFTKYQRNTFKKLAAVVPVVAASNEEADTRLANTFMKIEKLPKDTIRQIIFEMFDHPVLLDKLDIVNDSFLLTGGNLKEAKDFIKFRKNGIKPEIIYSEARQKNFVDVSIPILLISLAYIIFLFRSSIPDKVLWILASLTVFLIVFRKWFSVLWQKNKDRKKEKKR